MSQYETPVLNERETTHGDYSTNALIAQKLKIVVRTLATANLSCTQLESLDLIFTKIGRICSGDPNQKDHWDDIAGYAKLISEKL